MSAPAQAKAKIPSSNPIARLHDAAKELIDRTRAAMKESGVDQPELTPLHIPIVMNGTDFRVVIESGPNVATANAIQSAAISAGNDASDLDFWAAARRAADIILRDAKDLKDGHTKSDAPDDWTGEEDAKNNYDEMMSVADALMRGN